VADKVIIASPEVIFRQEIQHVRCGGTYLAHSKGKSFPTMANVRYAVGCWRSPGDFWPPNCSTAGTPLAEELGMPVSIGQTGLTGEHRRGSLEAGPSGVSFNPELFNSESLEDFVMAGENEGERRPVVAVLETRAAARPVTRLMP
jgi:hypothetical protein